MSDQDYIDAVSAETVARMIKDMTPTQIKTLRETAKALVFLAHAILVNTVDEDEARL